MFNRHVLFHDDSDGLASAAVLYGRYGSEITYTAVQYGQPFPDFIELNPNTQIIIVDFSYTREILEDVYSKVGSLLVIDHHKTAKEDLKDLPYAVFDMDYSGATLVWQHYNQNKSREEIPLVYQLVEDRDLWRFKLEDSKAFEEGMRASPRYREIPYWSQVVNDPDELALVIQRGRSLLEQVQNVVNNFIKTRKYAICNFKHQDKNHKIALYNTTSLISEIAEGIYSDQELDVDFTMSFFITSEAKVIFSFRSSKKKNIDVGSIAKTLGGGGHANAAGASLNFQEGIEFLKTLYQL